MEKTIIPFGEVEQRPVDLITLRNSSGMKVSMTNYGCIVTSIEVPDRNGQSDDVVLGYETLEKYLAGHPFFGAIAGRFANRIQDGKFSIDGETYQLETNEPPTAQHLHGGSRGFDKYVWGYEVQENDDAIAVHLHRVSPDGESGYPGTLTVRHTISLNEKNELGYDFSATTDKPTILNLVNHSYYNLAGHDSGSIADLELTLFADVYTPVAENMIPTGEIRAVVESPLDFRSAVRIGDKMDQAEGGAFDFNYILDGRNQQDGLALAANLYDPKSGRFMEILTTQPAIQFYNGFKLSNKPWFGRNGHKYEAFGGMCLETQGYPDAPNKPHFPSAILRPGEVYAHRTLHRFGVR